MDGFQFNGAQRTANSLHREYPALSKGRWQSVLERGCKTLAEAMAESARMDNVAAGKRGDGWAQGRQDAGVAGDDCAAVEGVGVSGLAAADALMGVFGMTRAIKILAIDPGTHESGFCLYSAGRVLSSGVMDNHDMLRIIADDRSDVLAIEKVVSYGRAVGQEVFDTCEWAGRFRQVWGSPDETLSVTRLQVKKALGLMGSADDAKVNAALRATLGEKGTKASPGPLYGVTSHAWAALGVAYAAAKMQ